jgi:hypothetical protein
MKNISLIHRSSGPLSYALKRIEGHTYRSASWVLSQETIKSLIGGRVFLHEKQDERSYFGGEILDIIPSEIPGLEGRFDIIFKALPECRDVRCPGGWGREKAIWSTETKETA